MTSELLSLTYQLKELLENDSRVLLLNEAEKKMNESDEVMSLAYKKDMALDKYNEMLKYYSDDSEEVRKARQELSSAKKNLEEHILVRDYLTKYQEVRMLYEKINNELFSYLNSNMCPSK